MKRWQRKSTSKILTWEFGKKRIDI
jgi:hypothetical protein